MAKVQHYKIKSTVAGDFKRGDIKTQKEIEDSGADFEFWNDAGVLEPVDVLSQEEIESDDYLDALDPIAASTAAAEKLKTQAAVKARDQAKGATKALPDPQANKIADSTTD